ncbi:MAG: DUF2652 domain-containing protein, partial [Saprospiraceae bacterium]|nr:DUF2652 domain-containing protein [Saprospiraceae bacterium]
TTEVEHSQHIISELLELMIDANEMEMTLAEIEGDALFFYLEGKLPPASALLHQIEKIYLAFHQHLLLYNHQRICNCGACKTAVNLQLKFVVHIGESQFIEVKGSRKPFGKEVIVVHRLLKNDVPLDEYILISNEASSMLSDLDLQEPLAFRTLSTSYDAGDIPYHYASITQLRDRLELPQQFPAVPPTSNPLRFSVEINQKPEVVFEVISNLSYRHKWNKDAEIMYDANRVNRAGEQHQCLVSDRLLHFETLQVDLDKEIFIYGERTADIPFHKELVQFFKVHKTGQGSRVDTELHFVAKNRWLGLLSPIIRRKLGRSIPISLHNLKSVAEHADQVVHDHLIGSSGM